MLLLDQARDAVSRYMKAAPYVNTTGVTGLDMAGKRVRDTARREPGEWNFRGRWNPDLQRRIET